MSTAQEVRLVVKYFGPLLRRGAESVGKTLNTITKTSPSGKGSTVPAAPSSKSRLDRTESSKRSYSTDAVSGDWMKKKLPSKGSLTSWELKPFL
eukprot:g6437.t1